MCICIYVYIYIYTHFLFKHCSACCIVRLNRSLLVSYILWRNTYLLIILISAGHCTTHWEPSGKKDKDSTLQTSANVMGEEKQIRNKSQHITELNYYYNNKHIKVNSGNKENKQNKYTNKRPTHSLRQTVRWLPEGKGVGESKTGKGDQLYGDR